MTKYRYEFGKRWDARVPRGIISHILGSVHVGTPGEEVAVDIRRRTEGNPAFTPSLVKQSIAYALECHGRNRGLYRRVMGGAR